MRVTPARAAELAREAGLNADAREAGNAVHVSYMLGNSELRAGLMLPLTTIEDMSGILDIMRGIESKPYLREQADRFIELLTAEEAALTVKEV